MRLSYLYKGELFATIMFVFLGFIVNRTYPELRLYSLYSFWFSFVLLEFLLLQGTVYWYAKWKRLKTEKISITPIQIVKRFKGLGKWNITWILVTPVAFIIDLIKWYPEVPVSGMALTGFIYFFACLEYINYFHIQLSYDNRSDIRYLLRSRKLKKSCLSKDFRRLN